MTSKATVYDQAEELLARINQVYIDNDETLPSRQFISGGRNTDAPHDCEQVVVSFEQVYNGPPGAQVQEPSTCASPRSVVFTVEVVRCQPPATKVDGRSQKMSPPTPSALSAAARVQAIDAWLLLDAGLMYAEDMSYLGGLGDVTVGPESGLYQGVILSLVVGAN